jgi:hypothetical protein
MSVVKGVADPDPDAAISTALDNPSFTCCLSSESPPAPPPPPPPPPLPPPPPNAFLNNVLNGLNLSLGLDFTLPILRDELGSAV